jgi:hypothetical protein
MPDKELINSGRRHKVRARMVMDEMKDRRWDHGRSRIKLRNKQPSQGRPSRRVEVNREPLSMDTLQSGHRLSRPSSPITNRNI